MQAIHKPVVDSKTFLISPNAGPSTRANEGMQGISWNILGQTYVPKSCTDHSFSWHATLPPGTFVPPHIHPDQDEYLYMLEGKLDFMLGDGRGIQRSFPAAAAGGLTNSPQDGLEPTRPP